MAAGTEAGRPSGNLFISHNAADRPFAVALRDAIYKLVFSETLIPVEFSSDEKVGPQGGEDWRSWIDRQVVQARTALIVVTPNALGKPWLLWEAGACWGATLAQQASQPPGDETSSRLNVTIAYGLTENECPDPLRGDQIVPGLNPKRVKALLKLIMKAHAIPSEVREDAGDRMQDVLDDYVEAARKALLQSPSLVTEANVQDWLERLDALAQAKRFGDLPNFERWMGLAFGRDGEAASIPIDVRLHRRLGELYLGQSDEARAERQFALARRAAPRDIFVLRPLVEVTVKRMLSRGRVADAAEQDNVRSMLDAIQDLDERAFVASPDAAAQYGKFERRIMRNPERAVAIFRAALRENPDSFYLADVLAQSLLELGSVDEARETYRDALSIIAKLREHDVWTHASAAAAHLLLGDFERARAKIAEIDALANVSPADIKSVGAGLREIAQRAGIAEDIVTRLLTGLGEAGAGAASTV